MQSTQVFIGVSTHFFSLTEAKLLLFTDNMIVYIKKKKSMHATTKLLELIREFCTLPKNM